MTNTKKEASETREHHAVRVEVRTLSDTEQVQRRRQAGRLDPNNGGGE